jgi:hypothetical protein
LGRAAARASVMYNHDPELMARAEGVGRFILDNMVRRPAGEHVYLAEMVQPDGSGDSTDLLPQHQLYGMSALFALREAVWHGATLKRMTLMELDDRIVELFEEFDGRFSDPRYGYHSAYRRGEGPAAQKTFGAAVYSFKLLRDLRRASIPGILRQVETRLIELGDVIAGAGSQSGNQFIDQNGFVGETFTANWRRIDPEVLADQKVWHVQRITGGVRPETVELVSVGHQTLAAWALLTAVEEGIVGAERAPIYLEQAQRLLSRILADKTGQRMVQSANDKPMSIVSNDSADSAVMFDAVRGGFYDALQLRTVSGSNALHMWHTNLPFWHQETGVSAIAAARRMQQSGRLRLARPTELDHILALTLERWATDFVAKNDGEYANVTSQGKPVHGMNGSPEPMGQPGKSADHAIRLYEEAIRYAEED